MNPEQKQIIDKEFEDLEKLELGWDSYDGLPPSHEKLVLVKDKLIELMNDKIPIPSIIPLSSGDIQVEWHTNGIDIKVEFYTENTFYLFYENHKTFSCLDCDRSDNMFLLKKCVESLTDD